MYYAADKLSIFTHAFQEHSDVQVQVMLMHDFYKCPYSRNFTAIEKCLSLLQGLVSFSVCWSTEISLLIMCLARLGSWKVRDKNQENNFFKSHFLLYQWLITSKTDFSNRHCANLAYMFC